MSKLTVTYKRYEHFSQIPSAVLTKLMRLNIGSWGVMQELIREYRSQYLEIDRRGNVSYYMSLDEMARSISVAFVGSNPVGWSVTDNGERFNVYVQTKYRKLGIAQNLAIMWAEENIERVELFLRRPDDVVHNDDAAKVMSLAAFVLGITKKRRKYTTVVHNIPTLV